MIIAAAAATSSSTGPHGPNRPPLSFDWNDHLGRLNADEFRRRYRLTPVGFYELLTRLWPKLHRPQKRKGGKRRASPHVMLAVALRFFSGGSVDDLKLIYGLRSRNTVYSLVWRAVDAINHTLTIHFPIRDTDWLREREAEFAACSSAPLAWRGQVGAVDGVHFAMQNPGTFVDDSLRYHVYRKDKYAMLCIAVCDAKLRFTYYDMSQIPTTHDGLAWSCSPLGSQEKAGELPAPYFFNGDSAFASTESMVTPSAGADDDFDFYQSSNRVCIERAFGVLVKRFPLLWRPLCVRFDRVAPLIAAIMRVHNFCIDQGIAEESVQSRTVVEIQPNRYRCSPYFDKNGSPVHYLDTDGHHDSDATRDHRRKGSDPATYTRAWLMRELKAHGYTRPSNALRGLPRKVKGKKKKKKKPAAP